LPKIISIGIQWSITAAQAIASFAVMSAQAVVNAAITTAAWVVSAAKSLAAFVASIPKTVAQFVIASAAAVVNAAITTAAWVASAAKMLAGWVVAFAGYLIGVASSVAATVAAGIAMAAAWLMALGPIGLIIAAVAIAVGLIIANWETVKNVVIGVWNGITAAVQAAFNWVKTNWPLLLAIITGPIGLAVLAIVKNWQTIKDAAGAAFDFIKGIPGRIVSAIGNMGSLLYNSGRDLIQGLLNGAASLLSTIGNFFLSKVPAFIRDPFKKALGINSPSKVFAEFGDNIGQGLINGVDAKGKAVTKAIGNMATDAMAAMAGVDDAMSSGYNTNVTASQRLSNEGYTQAPKVVQHNEFNVAEKMDVKQIASDLGFAVAQA
jgi:phage-related protein